MLPYEVSTAMQGQTNISPRDVNAQNVQAGYTNLMVEDDPLGQTYFDVLNELEEVGYSPTTQAVNDILYQEEQQRMTDMLPDILLDAELSDEEKMGFVDAASSGDRPENTLAFQYGRDKLEETEPQEIEQEYRTNKDMALESLQRITDYNLALDAAIDQTTMSENPSFASSAADFMVLMIPFWEQSSVSVLRNAVGGTPEEVAKGFVLMGENKDAMRKAWQAMPLEERTKSAELFVNAITEASSNTFMTNELNARGLIDAVLYGDYADWERWLDNAVSLLDLSLVGKPVKWGADGVKRLAAGQRVVSEVRNSSPMRMAQETNATATRSHVNAMAQDASGEAAQALTGASREDAIIDAVGPQVGIGGQGLRQKVGNSTGTYEKSIIANPDLNEAVAESAIGALTKKELTAANARVINRLQRAKGVDARREMWQVNVNDTGAKIHGVYGPTEGAWTNAADAKELTLIAMRNEGVSPDSIQILKKGDDGLFKPVDGVPSEDGQYLTAFDFDYDYRFSDVMNNWSEFDVKKNFLDRTIIGNKMNLNRLIFDPASTLDPHIVFGANAAVDKSARITKIMLNEAKNFTDKVNKLSDEGQQAVMAYIKEANEKGLKFVPEQVRADWNFNDDQLEAIGSFRAWWDDVWAIRNRTDAKALADQGYVILEDAVSDTRIYGRPRDSARLDKNKSIFLPDSEDLVDLDFVKDRLDAGTHQVIQMRRPLDYDGVITDYVLVEKSQVRNMTKSDIVYPYREGYYEVSYNQPHFIVKRVVDGDNEYTKAIATAETKQDVDLYLKRIQENEGLTDAQMKEQYFTRADIKNRDELVGYQQDMYETYGHGNQRARGKKLEDATAVVRNTEQSNIKDPISTMIDTSRLMGNRVAMTDYLNATKQRFLQTYADVLPKDRFGQPEFPARVDDIGRAAPESSRAADARTTFEYISYLENGYVNSMSEVSKAGLRAVADYVGAKGFGRLEKGTRFVAEGSATDLAKNAAFQLYIALNPLRQGLLNAHQSSLLLASFPSYMVNPRGMAADFTAFADLAVSGGKNLDTLAKATGRSADELRLMYREFQKSGLADSIDVHNMVRGSLVEFTEGTRLSQNPIVRGTGAGLRGVRKAGFDSGEWVNMATSWLAHYDKAAEGGKALTKTDFHKIGAEARNYTFNMSRAGDMPYNRNAAGMIFQFFQVPHKAALQLSNRGLTGRQRATLGAYNALAFGLPAGAMYTYFGDVLPDPDKYPEAHNMAVQGLEFYMWNWMIEGMTGEDTNIDFSSLSPFDPYGVYETIHEIMTGELGSLIANSPAGGLFFGDNARVTQLAKTAARFFNPTEDFADDPVTGSHVFNDLAHLSSGMSNLYKAWMALEHGKLYSARGAVVDPKVSTPEAIALAFGFPTMDAAREYALNNKLYKTKEAARKDVDKWYNEYTTRLAREGITADEIDYEVKVFQQSMRVFARNEFAQERIKQRLAKDIERGRGAIYDAVLRLAGQLSPEEVSSMLKTLPYDDPTKRQQLIESVEFMRKNRNNGEN